MEKIEVFELVIDEENETGVDYIALVDYPAIERNFMKFNQDKEFKFMVEDDEQRIVSGYAMLADLPILRVMNNQSFYVVFKKDTIKQIAFKFFKEGKNSNVNLDHDLNKIADGVFVFESMLIDEQRGIKAPEKYGNAPDGSWFVSMKVNNEEIWQQIKEGSFRGFSVEGNFDLLKPVAQEQDQIDELIDLIQKDAKFSIWLTEYVEDGKTMCGSVDAKDEDHARKILDEQGKQDRIIIGQLVDVVKFDNK